MKWNYRVVKETHETSGSFEATFSIHEAYYNTAGEVTAITEKPIAASADSPEELVQTLRMMQKACAGVD
jgi:hypothetical protein